MKQLTTVKNKFNNVFQKIGAFISKRKAEVYAFFGTVPLMCGMPVYASAFGAKVEPIASFIVDYIITAIGVFFILAGAVKLFLAYRNNNPDSQTEAAKDIVIGVGFVAFRMLYDFALVGLFN